MSEMMVEQRATVSHAEKVGLEVSYVPMQEITEADYEALADGHKEIEIIDRLGKRRVRIPIGQNRVVKKFRPKDFEVEGTSLI